ncbi:Gfo/Idh/MocA family protein [Marinicrinis lubricantis]|uniref:Gfo/Idh/MocA family protein n=1 Tax=Marinicrinis lubricantis TaxID=2086470 RepID=A0ABW1IRE4_9BACL
MNLSVEPLKIGIIGLDTSHVTAFTAILNDSNHPYHVPGGRVVAAYPGGSADFELSRSRVAGYTETLSSTYGVDIMDDIEEVAASCDAILLESVDGRVHLEQFSKLAPYGKPVFIDKPLAVTSEHAISIAKLANQYEVPFMSCSALRYAEGLTSSIADESLGRVLGVDCYGPMEIQPTQPGLFWYGIHTAEMMYTVMGTGCREVIAVSNTDYDLITGIWHDCRIGTLRGNRKGNRQFGALLHREQGTAFADVYANPKPYYASMLERIMDMFHSGHSPVSMGETLEIIRFLEAANESRSTGSPVML